MDEKKWYLSKAVWGGLVAVGAAVAGAFGLQIDGITQDEIAEYAVAIAGAAGGLFAIYGRLVAKKKIK